jgi:hypothetical protein
MLNIMMSTLNTQTGNTKSARFIRYFCNGLLRHLLCRGLSYMAGAIGPEGIEVIGDDRIIECRS